MRLRLVSAVAPDLDLLWSYTLGERARVHHGSWPHLPGTCLLLTLAWVTAAVAQRRRPWVLPALVVGVTGVLNLMLDSLTDGIAWLHPASPVAYRLVEVPALHRWWVWTFLLPGPMSGELLIIAAALFLIRRDRANANRRKGRGD